MNPPPLLVSFSDVKQYIGALSSELASEFGPEIIRLKELGLPPIVSIRCLSVLFGFSSSFVWSLANRPSRYYRQFVIPKGNGKRQIQAPRVALKIIQKWIGFHIAETLKYPPYVFGFVKGRSSLQAAAVHCSARWVYSTDIKNFFQTTRLPVVCAAVETLGYSQKGSKILSALCCYNDGLAQGSPASPALSNLVFQPVDDELAKIAIDANLRYTRYADDIVFSGLDSFPKELPREIKHVIHSRGWEISTEKEQLAFSPKRLKVHGLVVHGDKPRLTKGYRNRIRAYKHLAANDRVAQEDISKINGHIAYAASIENI